MEEEKLGGKEGKFFLNLRCVNLENGVEWNFLERNFVVFLF